VPLPGLDAIAEAELSKAHQSLGPHDSHLAAALVAPEAGAAAAAYRQDAVSFDRDMYLFACRITSPAPLPDSRLVLQCDRIRCGLRVAPA